MAGEKIAVVLGPGMALDEGKAQVPQLLRHPGHGGAYDRFDSASFAAPTVLVLLKLLEVF